jgi:hypothetical protein
MVAELFDAGRIEVGSPASASSTALRVKAFDTPTSNAAASVASLREPTGLLDPPSRTGASDGLPKLQRLLRAGWRSQTNGAFCGAKTAPHPNNTPPMARPPGSPWPITGAGTGARLSLSLTLSKSAP